MKRSYRLFTLACILICCDFLLLLAVAPAWGSPGRMVLVNGKLHRILRNSEYSDNRIKYSRGHADQDWQFDDSKDPITLPALSTPWPCDANIPVYGTDSNALELFAAEGLAVFDNKIWVAYTADAECSNPSAGMATYISAFDLTPTADAPDGHWMLFPKEVGSNVRKQYYTMGAGSAHTDTPAQGWGSGAAITVFNNGVNNQLYLFSDNGVYTSGDGITWAYHNRPFSINAPRDAQHEPLDAVTINTPDGQRILIVYGYISGKHYYYDHVDAVDWNGKFGTESQAHIYNDNSDYSMYDAYDSGLFTPSGNFRARVSLTVGTKAKGNAGDNDDLAAGVLAPAVQLFGQSGEQLTTSNHNPARHAEYVYTSIDDGWGTWTWDSTRIKYFDHVNPSLMVYPWSKYQCNSDHLGSNQYPKQGMSQYIVLLGGFTWWIVDSPFAFVSDFLVPQNEVNTACTYTDADGNTQNTPPPAGIENNTNTNSSYWTLVGVVLGTPPFSTNGTTTPSLIDKLSDVSITQDSTESIDTTTEWENSLSLSVGHKITAGLFDVFKVSKSFDASYKHTWEKESGTKSTVGLEIKHTYGSGTGLEEAVGTVGWLVISAPHVYVQDWTVYGYDYKVDSDNASTALSFLPDVDCSAPSAQCLNLQTISTKGTPDFVDKYFDLRNPSASGTLFDGMGSFGYQDVYNNPDNLDYWKQPTNLDGGEVLNWQYDERWETRAGDGGTTFYPCPTGYEGCQYITKLLASSGSTDSSTYTLEKETMSGEGHTNEISLQRGSSFGGELGLDGLSLGAENSLTVGYEGKFSVNTKTTTGTGTSIDASQTVPYCLITETDCYSEVNVRPYWLHAVAEFTDDNPWIPSFFKGQTPWLLTWQITSACNVGDRNCSIGTRTSANAGAGMTGFSGTAPPPANAFGRIVNGNGGGDGGAPYSHYVIQGGRLAWVNDEGWEQSITMTADEFVPSKGVTIEVAGGSWSSSGNGSWRRSGDRWTFRTNPGVKPRVTLRLDFGSATYDLNIQKADLNGRMLAGETNTRLVLGINQLYTFYTLLQHDIDITWRWSMPPADNLTSHVMSFSGRYNSANESGKMSITGTLPADLPTFGDVEINVNGHPYVVRLITMDGFQEAFETGGDFRFSKEGLNLVIDFGRKTWSATFNKKAFQSLAPKWGSMRAKLIVGGVPWLTVKNAVFDYSANLALRRYTHQVDCIGHRDRIGHGIPYFEQ